MRFPEVLRSVTPWRLIAATALVSALAACSGSPTTADAHAAIDGTPGIDGIPGIDAPVSSIDASTIPDGTTALAVITPDPTTVSDFGSIFDNGSDVSDAAKITLSNSGTATATSLTVTIVNDTGDFFNVSNSNCGVSLDVSGKCAVSITFGPTTTAPGNDHSKTATLRISYKDGASLQTLDIPLSGTLNHAQQAVISATLTHADNFNGGQGEQLSPLTVTQGKSGELTVEYSNAGPVDAEQFSTNAEFPVGWSLVSNGCADVTLSANNGSVCDDVYVINEATAGEDDYDVQDSVLAV